MKSLKVLAEIMVYCILALFVLSCNSSKSEYKRVNSAIEFFQNSKVDHHSTSILKDNSNLVIVIGENHASINNQKYLAEILDTLKQKGLLDQILIEGSNGKIKYDNLLFEFKTKSKSYGIEADIYWKQQLDWGLISGYEYFALTHPGIDVVGVEDMAAKDRYALTSHNSSDVVRIDKSSHNRAIKMFSNYLFKLKDNVNKNDYQLLENEFDTLKNAIDEYNSFAVKYLNGHISIEEEYNYVLSFQKEYYRISNELKDPLEILSNDFLSLDTLKYKEYRNAALSLQRKSKTINQNDNTQVNSFNEEIKHFQAYYSECYSFTERQNKFYDDYGEQYDRYIVVSHKLDSLNKIIETKYIQLKPYYTKRETIINNIEDYHFILANHVRQHCGYFKLDADSLINFFKYDNVQIVKDSEKDNIQKLAERDIAMVQNTENQLILSTDKIVVLIVGYAHVEGITQKLKNKNISFISGGLVGRDIETEPWEDYSWKKRKSSVSNIFSTPNGMKEITKLLNKQWGKDQEHFISYFNKLGNPTISGLYGDSKIYNNLSDKNLSIHIGGFNFNKNANFGDYVIERGIVPNKNNQYYEIYDRSIAEKLVKENSTNETKFAYYYKEKNQDGTIKYKIVANQKVYGFNEFKSELKSGKRYVLFGESDEISEGGIIRSELMKELKKETSGGGKPPINNSGENIFRTINPERANMNLTAISKQRTEFIKKFVVVEEKDMQDLTNILYSSPSRGDYSHTIVFMVKNTAEYRNAINNAAKNKLLKNKQVILITCGDSFIETNELSESILNGGALTVWVPERQIPEPIGKKLLEKLIEYDRNTKLQDREVFIDRILNKVIYNWEKEEPNSGSGYFKNSASWVNNMIDIKTIINNNSMNHRLITAEKLVS